MMMTKSCTFLVLVLHPTFAARMVLGINGHYPTQEPYATEISPAQQLADAASLGASMFRTTFPRGANLAAFVANATTHNITVLPIIGTGFNASATPAATDSIATPAQGRARRATGAPAPAGAGASRVRSRGGAGEQVSR